MFCELSAPSPWAAVSVRIDKDTPEIAKRVTVSKHKHLQYAQEWKISRYFRKYRKYWMFSMLLIFLIFSIYIYIGYFQYFCFIALDWVMPIERLVFKLYISEWGLEILRFALHASRGKNG